MEIPAGPSLSAGLQVASISGKQLDLDGKGFFTWEACYIKFLWYPKPQILKLSSVLVLQDLSHVSSELSMSVWKFSSQIQSLFSCRTPVVFKPEDLRTVFILFIPQALAYVLWAFHPQKLVPRMRTSVPGVPELAHQC